MPRSRQLLCAAYASIGDASILLPHGVSPAYMQRQLGHATITLTVDTSRKWHPAPDKAGVDSLDGTGGVKVVSPEPSATSAEGDATS
jgi:hypothetical protein